MDTNTPHQAAIYCRISQDRADAKMGVIRQEELCRQRAHDLGWTIAEVYIDNDVSAYSGAARPAFQRMCEDIRRGSRDGVVVLDQDRLVRHVRELEDFIDLANEQRIGLANVSGRLDLSSTDGRFMARTLGALARYESEQQSQRLKRQREQAAKHGLPHPGGRRPYGYTRNYEIDPAEADNIREAAHRYLAGESLTSVASDWNDRGIEPVAARAWRASTLRTMLASPHLAALRSHKGEVVAEGQWEPILTREEHERLKVALGDPRRRRKGRPPKYLLTSLLRCGRCGAVLQSSKQAKRNRRNYICRNGPGLPGCGRLSVSAAHAEEFVTEMVLDALSSSRLPALISDEPESDERRARAVAELAACSDRLEELGALFGAGKIARSEWLAARDAVEKRRVVAHAALQKLEQSETVAGLLAAGPSLFRLWEDANTDRRRTIMRALLDDVVVHPAARGANSFDPSRLEPTWRV